MNVGDIGAELEAVDFAHSRFQEAVEGPCMEDYATDEEAYERLSDALRQLRDAAIMALNRLPPVAASSPLPAPQKPLEILRDDMSRAIDQIDLWPQDVKMPAGIRQLLRIWRDEVKRIAAIQEPLSASPLPAGQTDDQSWMINQAAFEQLITEDLAWLDSLTSSSPGLLERAHVREIVRNCVKHYYPPARPADPEGDS